MAKKKVGSRALQFGQTTEYGRKCVSFDKPSGSAIIGIIKRSCRMDGQPPVAQLQPESSRLYLWFEEGGYFLLL